jgi:hypothetical protein
MMIRNSRVMMPVMLYRILIATAVVGAGPLASGEPEGELCWVVEALALMAAWRMSTLGG